MEYKTITEGSCSIITLTGDVDLETSPQAREQILQALKNNQHVLVDLSEVEYIDSSGIASLVEGYQDAKGRNLSIGLVNISDAARQVLQLARLDQVFPIFDNVDDGLAAQ